MFGIWFGGRLHWGAYIQDPRRQTAITKVLACTGLCWLEKPVGKVCRSARLCVLAHLGLLTDISVANSGSQEFLKYCTSGFSGQLDSQH